MTFRRLARNAQDLVASVQPNDPARAGQPAGRRLLFGEGNRFAVYAVHTRFDSVQWIVTDAELATPPEVIRQASSLAEALELDPGLRLTPVSSAICDLVRDLMHERMNEALFGEFGDETLEEERARLGIGS